MARMDEEQKPRKRRRTKSKKEIERKWVLAAPPSLDGKEPDEIRQGYVFTGNGEMRVRRAGARCFLTVKRNAGDARDEWESEIPEWVFDAIWPSTKGRRLRKRRYTWREGRRNLELDIYEGKLEGLIVLESEFRSKKSSEKFTLPDWAAGAIEVSDDPHFRNEVLAEQGLKGLRRRLKPGTSTHVE